MLTFRLACAPSKSRPRMRVWKVRADARKLRDRLGPTGIGTLTEISNPLYRWAVRRVFGRRRAHPLGTDTPIVWTPDWERVDSGKDFGCAGIRGIAPTRHTVWAILRHTRTGALVGVVTTHMMPGGNHPSERQKPHQEQIRRLWGRHADRLEHRVRHLRQTCDAVATTGDINHPGDFTFTGDHRASAPGIVYVAVQGHATAAEEHSWIQQADHRARIANITLTTKKAPR